MLVPVAQRDEMTKAMNDLVWSLKFTGEDGSMYDDGKLPTLDTNLWVSDEGKLKYVFFENPTVPNQVLQRDTALSEARITARLTQEVVRRLANCSLE